MKTVIKKGDTVLVLAGKDRQKRGKVIAVLPKKGKVKVEAVNVVTRHMKPRKADQKAGIVRREAFMDISNVMLIDQMNGKPARACKVKRDKQ